MKKILYFGNSLIDHGKTPTGIDTLSKQLESLGYDVIVSGKSIGKLARMAEMINDLRRHHKSTNYVLIDTYSTSAFWFAFVIGLMCKYLYRLKYIPILRGGSLPLRIKISKRLADVYFNNAFQNVAISDYMKNVFDQHNYRSYLINNNIDVNNYVRTIRDTFKPKILWVRAFHKDYNPNMAIDVMVDLLNDFPDAFLCMVGPDKDGTLEKTKSYCREKNIENYVEFKGYLSKPEWHQLSLDFDIFINTTNFDNTPISVIESMALGLPVVSTNVGGIQYLLNNNYDALLVEKANVAEMCKAISSIILDPAKGKKLVLNSQITLQKYSWDSVKHLWIDLLK